MHGHIELNKGLDFLDYRNGSGGTVEIFDIAVNSGRQKGRGRALVDALVNKVRGNTHLIFAITRESNWVAHMFYAKTGFILIAQLPGFYADEGARMYGLKI